MRQNSRVEPPTQQSSAITLHPVLSSALANLDIQLEDELTRYRRQRSKAGWTVRQPGRKRSPESLDLIAVSATVSGHSTTSVAQPAPVLDERLADVAGKSSTPDAYKPIPAFTANPQPFEGAIALRAPINPLNHDGNADSVPPVGDDSHALAQTANPNLADYLESSEELLRSLADEQAEVQAERNFMRSLLTPLGLGAMLLLLLSSAMFGYVIMNPSSLPWLTANKPPVGNGGSNNTAAGLPTGANGGSAAIAPPQPDLTKPELQDLNLNNLGTANVNSGKASSPAPGIQVTPTLSSKPTVAATNVTPAEPQSSSQPAAPAPAPIPAATSSSISRPYARTTEAPQVAPSRSVPVQAPISPVRRAPATTAPVSITSSPGAGGSFGPYQYKVGIPFENDQTLENARKVVPDAFVRTLPDGRTIVQVGAARDEAEGRANMQKLHDQGLSSTEVYKR